MAKDDLNLRYGDLCAHFRMEPTRNNRGLAHENCSIESSHRHYIEAFEQVLILRGSRDFDNAEDYTLAHAGLSGRRTADRADLVVQERAHLQPLPERRACDYDEARVKVTNTSCFTFRNVTYSVPSLLIGHTLTLRAFDDRIEAYLGGALAETLPRGRPSKGGCGHVVNYHHVIHSLRKKPGAGCLSELDPPGRDLPPLGIPALLGNARGGPAAAESLPVHRRVSPACARAGQRGRPCAGAGRRDGRRAGAGPRGHDEPVREAEGDRGAGRDSPHSRRQPEWRLACSIGAEGGNA